MQTFMRIALLTTGVYMIYKYRYRLFNTLFSSKMLRTMAVSTAMRLPSVRQKMMEQVFK